MTKLCPSRDYAEDSSSHHIETWWCRDCNIRMCEGCVDDPVCPECGTEQVIYSDWVQP